MGESPPPKIKTTVISVLAKERVVLSGTVDTAFTRKCSERTLQLRVFGPTGFDTGQEIHTTYTMHRRFPTWWKVSAVDWSGCVSSILHAKLVTPPPPPGSLRFLRPTCSLFTPAYPSSPTGFCLFNFASSVIHRPNSWVRLTQPGIRRTVQGAAASLAPSWDTTHSV